MNLNNHVFLVCSLLSQFVAGEAWAATGIGNLAFVKGEVVLDGKRAVNAAVVLATSKIQTEAGSCTLLIGESTVVHVGEHSSLEVQKYLGKSKSGTEEIGIKLKVGKVKGLIGSNPDLPKNFEIQTRSNIMGVRGTEIFILSPADTQKPDTFLTLQGTAEIKSVNAPSANQKAGSTTGRGSASTTNAGSGVAPGSSSGSGASTDSGAASASSGSSEGVVLKANQMYQPGESVKLVSAVTITALTSDVTPQALKNTNLTPATSNPNPAANSAGASQNQNSSSNDASQAPKLDPFSGIPTNTPQNLNPGASSTPPQTSLPLDPTVNSRQVPLIVNFKTR